MDGILANALGRKEGWCNEGSDPCHVDDRLLGERSDCLVCGDLGRRAAPAFHRGGHEVVLAQ